MNQRVLFKVVVAGLAAAGLASCASFFDPKSQTSFFVTSANPGKGGDLGGLAGADALCTRLATAAGFGDKGWKAYLSTQATGGAPAVNARDRIGNGPWVNSKGVVVAYNSAELHGTNNINLQTALTDKGVPVLARPATPNQHDIMTGSQPDGTAMPPGRDATCNSWTSGGQGGAMVGHVDRTGTNPNPIANQSWNSSHITPGCAMPDLARVGGGGLFYCFAPK